MPDAQDYAARKTEFVSGHTGSSVVHLPSTRSLELHVQTSYLLWLSLPSSLKHQGSWLALLVEVLVLGLPLLAVLTVASEHAAFLNVAQIVSAAASRQFFNSESHETPPSPGAPHRRKSHHFGAPNMSSEHSRTPRSTTSRRKNSGTAKLDTSSQQQRKRPSFSRPFVTVYRAHMMIMTVLCILAVDFHIFPREFAKCEIWGTSIMDLGVGSFVFSLGLVQSLPILREQKEAALLQRCAAALKKSIGILCLGGVRLFMVKGTKYPGEHVTEYGVHWNFYITLALLPVAGSLLRGLWPKLSYFVMGIGVSLSHQVLLTFGGMQNWVLHAPRLTVLSANKEGIISLPGYIALFLLGIDTGLYILPSHPFWAYRSVNTRGPPSNEPQHLSTLYVMLALSAAWWGTLLFIQSFFDAAVSRVLANTLYICWVCAFNTIFLALYLCIQLVCTEDLTKATPQFLVPQTFTAINKNGLVVFLFANVLTGVVNLSIDTLNISDVGATIVMVAYILSVFGSSWGLRNVALRL